ncbi:MAG: peptide chain release factor 1 [Verrucomicrobia subdivision 6 bacterium BACL9 MAG-120924-bin69]|uniref:Peptide chain release factor 1 n=3 Tax=Verrucomicrobia subdivision 6 TaxID=134627 RepID=A0A0R2X8G5_9BACT|nr:MAG: peptide chain release factor 1 [Verrucomicrobia subdivision 6 bacterium BACL9 MAG-120507-bin52]KRP32175.1 MAG: peptide chain release factor 1 [Verrucomicrobia subdivision 6 bacterium BACL9 MAG-120820-bin42]KRP33815.1 MAG: peptide chain release factor 1 [Verrucomicrobia subdivision 6 bacterium BACL9 MAG-120924-bin69]
MADPDLYRQGTRARDLAREHARIRSGTEAARRLVSLTSQIQENAALRASTTDPEMRQMAEEEAAELIRDEATAKAAVLRSILPPDPDEHRDTIVEIRAGAGGTEAAIFAGDLFRMYSRYAETRGWKLEPLSSSLSDLGGLKEIVFELTGQTVFAAMRHESGVHRVQRVPATEAQGRIHTSTATVAVLPVAEEVELQIRPDEVRIEVCRSGGPGGQGVNTTDSAVQVLHIPTGLIVRCQDSRSQIKNRATAMRILASRLLEKKREEERGKVEAARRQQVGSGERNEKIRTYNFPQNRLTDHRIGFTSHDLNLVMEGRIEPLVEALAADDLRRRLEESGLGA